MIKIQNIERDLVDDGPIKAGLTTAASHGENRPKVSPEHWK